MSYRQVYKKNTGIDTNFSLLYYNETKQKTALLVKDRITLWERFTYYYARNKLCNANGYLKISMP